MGDIGDKETLELFAEKVVSEYGKLSTIKSFGGSASDRAQAVCAAPGGTSVFVSGVTLSADNDFGKVDAMSNGSDAVAFEYRFDLEQG